MNDIQLSKHFKLSEFTKSSTAKKYHIDNTPTVEVISNLQALCQNVLEPLREYFNTPIIISSGYRFPTLNNHPNARGATNSQHMKGEAADLHLPSIAIGRKWVEYLLEYGHFDHLIWEHDSSGNYWIHVSFKRIGKNRQLYTPNLLKK